MNLTENSKTVLQKRYLLEGETPENMMRRASFGREDYYQMLSSLDFLPNSPTLMNAGTNIGTLSACFAFVVEDSMDSIMGVATKSALVQKWGGGVGYSLSKLRPKGAPVRSTQKRACGPVAVMKHYQSISEMVTQGGRRPGAQIAVLSCDHEDVREFIHAKDAGGLDTFNISVALTDEFMQSCTNKGLLGEMAESAWKTGDPGCIFIDTINRANTTPQFGPLEACNPCGESPLYDNEACNLGSINLANFVVNREIEWARLAKTVKLATRYLNTVLEKNQFPLDEVTKAVNRTRKIGLGVMGWADALALLNVHYDTEEAVELARNLMEFISDYATAESEAIAKEEPAVSYAYPCNATRTCIAPTGTIALIAGCSSGIEPHYALEWDRTMGDGTVLKEKIPVLDRCGEWFVPKTAHEIGWEWHLRHQAAFQKHTDLAVSKTINMPESATVSDVYNAYVMAWKLGCKGVTIYRDRCRSEQVLTTHAKPSVKVTWSHPVVNGRKRLPEDRDAVTHKFNVGGQEGYLTVGMYEDYKPGEIFIRCSKQGSTVGGLLDVTAILTSMSLQYGVPLESLIRKMKGVRFEPHGLTGSKTIPTAASIVDYVFRWLGKRFLTEDCEEVSLETGMVCPECGQAVVSESGCLQCHACGWTRCG